MGGSGQVVQNEAGQVGHILGGCCIAVSSGVLGVVGSASCSHSSCESQHASLGEVSHGQPSGSLLTNIREKFAQNRTDRTCQHQRPKYKSNFICIILLFT